MTDLGLTADFQTKLDALIAACTKRGVLMRPYFGLRDPVTQAKLWRQSRSWQEIQVARVGLVNSRAMFLVKCLDDAGTVRGKWATNALPGFSWHQYGDACDCVWIRESAECWDPSIDGMSNGYQVYSEEADLLGLRTLKSIGDWGHVQSYEANSPAEAYHVQKIDEIMQQKFGGTIK